ncbi:MULTISPECIES: lipoyl protein ligase domain-containing protein [unclassified Synechococcus]|uniref:lipoyl protein ligase domain-containing protein n=1 Tax=unclassified Synechococcus TaxID=2626047 RepID=UPI0021A408CE|nr:MULTISPECIES: lipoate--protein ligase family protein [unclassified Synechococcus]MCT0213048.1 lipoate--protein ligase family protein [Synechococcus sp. CS-1326]MCT0232293.1 lipoate--protein ligase family protein [Synechococcus sp. CS-1327]
MAIDEWLLDELVAGRGSAAFRFYTWSTPTLSLGFHQRTLEPHWTTLEQQGLIKVVRRPSGGRAVLHGGCLTYALLWPQAPGPRSLSYRLASQWLLDGFQQLGCPLAFGSSAPGLQRSSCFATSTSADLVEINGAKRVGSAQLWRQGHLLQHGSVQLSPTPGLWMEIFGAEPPELSALPIDGDALLAHLRCSAEAALGGGGFDSSPLNETELAAIDLRRQQAGSEPVPLARAGLTSRS